ncbi:MAG: isoaspartyl peptidase/L-asparaginase [bacterium]|nr:isoaspartyl peptidase/L-asparaginase [bacterium]
MGDFVLVHGGVDMPVDAETIAALSAAATRGWTTGPDAVDAVVAAVEALESDPLFNAGFGSVLNCDGEVEVDAAVVDGTRARLGAVAAVSGLRHPIRSAAALMRDGRAVLLTGAGARSYADSLGQPLEDLRTPGQVDAWNAFRSGELLSVFTGLRVAPSTETVGCIAYRGGTLVAGTSTGGMCGKPAGRVGDSAIFGAGHWANEEVAILCSGDGESIIKSRSASYCAALIMAGASLDDAVRSTIETLYDQSLAVGAVVAVARSSGAMAAAHNGYSFPVVVSDGQTTRLVESMHVSTTRT